MNLDKMLQEVRNDKKSGASEIMRKVINYLIVYSESLETDDPHEYYENLFDFGKKLIVAQPSMAPLFNVTNTLFLSVKKAIEDNPSLENLKRCVKSTSEELLSHSQEAIIEIKRRTQELIKGKNTILTHSYSSTILESLAFAHQEGMDFDVIVTESRPLFEGRKTAKFLAEYGIKVTLIADMAAFHFLDQVDLILMGCDCICKKGVVNKIGTKGLAIAASGCDKPFYFLSEKSKFLPSKYMVEPIIEDNDPEEIFKGEKDIDKKNIYFDVTPHKYYQGIVTEKGIINAEEIEAILEEIEVSKKLLLP